MWLTDTEQKQLLAEEPGPVTDKIRREVTVALRQVKERQEELRKKLEEHDGFIARFRRGMGAIMK